MANHALHPLYEIAPLEGALPYFLRFNSYCHGFEQSNEKRCFVGKIRPPSSETLVK
jgi:hypothetical protein